MLDRWSALQPEVAAMTAQHQYGRRDFLRTISMAAAGMAAVSCLPLRYATGSMPRDFKSRTPLADETARRFATTIIPVADASRSEVVDMLFDQELPFAKYCPLFLDLLNRRASELTGVGFVHCSAVESRDVVKSIIDDGGKGSQLCQAAIMIIQASFYGGSFDDELGCPSIGFYGKQGVFIESPSIEFPFLPSSSPIAESGHPL